MSFFKIKNLQKSYGNLQAIKGISLEVNKGEIFGILGPNGAGKSTALECALGVRKKDHGSVEILGLDPVADRKTLFSKVGVQFQDSSYQAGIRVGELCYSISSLYKEEPDWRNLLDEFGLMDKVLTPVVSCSGGERQRLSILLACMHRPELLFLDELTTGLDPLARRDVWKRIIQLNKSGTTVILTSHYMDEVETLCGRAVLINKGEILAEGSIEELTCLGKGKNLEESYVNLLGGVA